MPYLGKTPSQATRQRYYLTASGGETSISGTMTTGGTLTFNDGEFVDVKLNGVSLVAGTDYNTTTANTIGGLSALAANDQVEIVVYDTFSVFSGDVDGDFNINSGTLTVGTTTIDNNGDVKLADSDVLYLGTGLDLQIQHNGSGSFITDAGDGDLHIRTDTNLKIQNAAGSEEKAIFATDGAVTLYHDNSAKLATSAAGIDVTGTVTSDGASLDGAVVINESSNDVDFRVESNNNANMLVVDASADNVGIGTASPSAKLHVDNGSTHADVIVKGGDATTNFSGGSLLLANPGMATNYGGTYLYHHKAGGSGNTNAAFNISQRTAAGVYVSNIWNVDYQNSTQTFYVPNGGIGGAGALTIDSSGNTTLGGTLTQAGTLAVVAELGAVAFTTSGSWVSLGAISVPQSGIWVVRADLRLRGSGDGFVKGRLGTTSSGGEIGSNGGGGANTAIRMLSEQIEHLGSFYNIHVAPSWILDCPTGATYPLAIYLHVQASASDGQALNNNDSNGHPTLSCWRVHSTSTSGSTVETIGGA